MDHDRLRQLIDHPPALAEREPDPAFTAAVMARVAPAPAPAFARSQRLALGWLAAAVIAAAALLLPLDPFTSFDDLALFADGDLALELCAAALLGAAVLALRPMNRRIPA